MNDLTNVTKTALQGMGMNLTSAKTDGDLLVSNADGGGWHIACNVSGGVLGALQYFDELMAEYSVLTLIGWFKGMALYHAAGRHDEDEKHREMLEWLENGRYHRSNFFYEAQVWLDDDEGTIYAYAFTETEAESTVLQHIQQLHGPEATIDNIISVSRSERTPAGLKPVGLRVAQ